MDHDLLKEQIARANKAFYQRVFDDPWLGQLFQGVPRAHLESQQTDFMLGALGGPKKYHGRTPDVAHPHIFVTEEVWQAREKYLRAAFKETGFPDELAQRWLKIDEAFKRHIVKPSIDACTKRYTQDEILSVPPRSETRQAS